LEFEGNKEIIDKNKILRKRIEEKKRENIRWIIDGRR
jgi:hypothetical protein